MYQGAGIFLFLNNLTLTNHLFSFLNLKVIQLFKEAFQYYILITVTLNVQGFINIICTMI